MHRPHGFLTSDGADDFDGDGVSNADEAAAGTEAVAPPGPVRPAIWVETVSAATLYPSGSGSTVTKTLAQNGWNASAAARQDFLGDAVMTFRAAAVNHTISSN